jgi:DNA-binding sugar fermentation-stimulating protein
MAKETKRRINNMRIITLKDDYETILVETNAPEKVIKEAIDYRNENMDIFYSQPEFEVIADCVRLNGYEFDELNLTDEIYYW